MVHSIVNLICILIASTNGFRTGPPNLKIIVPPPAPGEAVTHVIDRQSKLRVFLAGLSHATDKKRCDNFRHQADTIAMYGLLRNRSVPANAITIVYGGSQRDCHDLMSTETRMATQAKAHEEILMKAKRDPYSSDEGLAKLRQKLAEQAAASTRQSWYQSWINYEEGLRRLDADMLAEDGEKPHVVTGSQVTVNNVLNALRQSVQSEHDDLFIYIATHGSAPIKTNGAMAGTLQVVTPHHSGQSFKDYLPAPLLLQTIGELPARRTFVFTQVCFSGAMWAAPNPPMGKNGVNGSPFVSTSVEDGSRCQAFSGSYKYDGVDRPPCERPHEMSEAQLDDCYWTSEPMQQKPPLATRSNSERDKPQHLPPRLSKSSRLFFFGDESPPRLAKGSKSEGHGDESPPLLAKGSKSEGHGDESPPLLPERSKSEGHGDESPPLLAERSKSEGHGDESPPLLAERSKSEGHGDPQQPPSRAERLKKKMRTVKQNIYAKAYRKAFRAFNPPNTKDIVAFSAAPWHLEAAGGLGVGRIPSYSSTASASFQRWLRANPCSDGFSSSKDNMRDLFTFINKEANKSNDQPGCGFETSGILGYGSMTWFGKTMSSLPVFAFTCPFGAARDEQILKLTSDVDHSDRIFRSPYGYDEHLLDTPVDEKTMDLPSLLPNSHSIEKIE